MVVLMDPMEDPEDILRANRSREKTFVFDTTFDGTMMQVTMLSLAHKHLSFTASLYGQKMSCVMRKPAFCVCKNRGADQLQGNCTADQRLCFAN